MTSERAKFWIYTLGTRPMWGAIPLRVIFGVLLALEGIARLTFARHAVGSLLDSLPHESVYAVLLILSIIEIVAAAFIIPGFLARFVGFFMVIEMTLAIILERIPLDYSRDLTTQVLFMGMAAFLFFSGAGRYSVDHSLALRFLKKFPNKKKELYCVAEMPLCKWWE